MKYPYYTWGRNLGRYWDKFLLAKSPLLKDFTPPSMSKRGLKLVCNVNNAYGNLKSENFQETSMKFYFHEFSFGLKITVNLCGLVSVCFCPIEEIAAAGGTTQRESQAKLETNKTDK
jgi:hypothetical protein